LKKVFIVKIIAEENDVVLIKNGDLYINDKFVDNQFMLNHAYIIERDYYNWLVTNKKKDVIQFLKLKKISIWLN
jgi:hypothetical protein